jgi:polyhydroxyalkanoate synthesis regulator phasin
MNLPVVIDIAIGLIFIYLILSLLTSEIQELLTILFQWRAEHLKRSIENLIEDGEISDPQYQKFTDKLYGSTLIKSLNQEATGRLAIAFRKIIQAITGVLYAIARTESVFRSQKSGPSYIPAETFSVALLEQINLKGFSQKIGELTVQKFADEKSVQLRDIMDELSQASGQDELLIAEDAVMGREYQNLQHRISATIAEFVSGRSTLSSSLDQISEQFLLFIDNTDSLFAKSSRKDWVRTQLSYLKQAIAHRQSEPTVSEILRLIFDEDVPNGTRPTPWVQEILTTLKTENPELVSQVSGLPKPLRRSLLSLADQAKLKSKNLQGEVNQLEKEVADWFDRSMERASGVYKRNSKGIAILIGFLFAIATNADTFYMISRLSKDTLLRSTIGQAADQAVTTSTAQPPGNSPIKGKQVQADLEEVKTAVNNVLDELPLPVGWNKIVVEEQVAVEKKGWVLPIPQRAIGWFITGVALSMGASFWYDLLGRFMKVRATGAKPEEKKD